MQFQKGFPVAPRSRAQIREAALQARSALRLPDGRMDIPRILDELTTYGLYYDVFDNFSAPVPIEVEACYVPELRTIFIRDTVYDEMARGGQRAVFTFGHELGHALLAHQRTFNRTASGQLPTYSDSEWQANVFSAEFTMPIDQIRRYGLQSSQEIAHHFGVSPKAATIRLSDLTRHQEILAAGGSLGGGHPN